MFCEAIPTAAKVAQLRKAATYPGQPPAVDVIETHMSWVFLTDQYVYKLKKPVRYDRLDFTTLEARRFYCAEELRLNRRLAESVYLDVVPLVETANGTIQLGGEGAVTDWLVKMRRLPADRMLDCAITHGSVGTDDARAVAKRLGEFHMTLPPAPITPVEYRRRLRQGIDECERELCDPTFALSVGQVRSLCVAQRELLERNPDSFDQRVHEGRIIEGHGDLRPEHVCLAPPLAIIDCLEFSPEYRTLDTADELGFLALECERLGAPEFGQVLLEAYGAVTGDRPVAALVHFYQSYRAGVRAKVAAWHLREEAFRDSPKWLDRTQQYLQLAQRHLHAAENAFQGGDVRFPAVR
ncbi:hypothetical protein [Paraburkholderia sp. RL17-373-BIF-A]|uniref:hypothetical protein n=1 Tax=Paraburkholderia sp. RL17-373-BIF-A TaxID=3031629 RepID=UPI0038B9B6DF